MGVDGTTSLFPRDKLLSRCKSAFSGCTEVGAFFIFRKSPKCMKSGQGINGSCASGKDKGRGIMPSTS